MRGLIFVLAATALTACTTAPQPAPMRTAATGGRRPALRKRRTLV